MKRIYQIMAFAILSLNIACNSNKKSQEDKRQENSDRIDAPIIDKSLFLQAALEGDVEKVSSTLEAGIDINTVDENQHTALMLAAYNGHHHVMKVLIDKGAKIEMVDGMNRTALMFASTGPFTQAVKMLINAGANVNATDNQEKWTPVMMAAAEGQLEVVKLLVANGADLSMVDVDGESSLDFANSNGHAAVVSYIEAQLK